MRLLLLSQDQVLVVRSIHPSLIVLAGHLPKEKNLLWYPQTFFHPMQITLQFHLDTLYATPYAVPIDSTMCALKPPTRIGALMLYAPNR
jgi:hypothetical protein